MSRSVNKAIIMGNLGADPELRSTGNGARVASLSIATGRQWTDKSGQKQEKTEWHRVVLWEKLADIAEKYLHKGDTVYIEGEIEYRSYQDKDGVTKYMTEIRGRELVMLGGKGEGGQQRQQGGGQKPAAKKEPTYDDFPAEFPDDSDDLPF